MDTNKKKYIKPAIDVIKIDAEISLQLESNAPDGPGESRNNFPDYHNADPYKNSVV